MMNHRFLELARVLLPAIMAGLTSSSASSQVTFQAGGGLGIIVPGGDYGGSTIEYYRGTKYGLSSGINVHGKVRAGFSKLTLVGGLDYSSLSNSGNSEPGQGRVEVSQKILSLKVGPEFQLEIQSSPVTPYLGANAAIHRISGETTFQGVSEVPSATVVVQATSRIGVGVSGGAIIKLNPSLLLDIGLQYNLMNIAGRSWEDVNPFKDQRLDSYLALNDDKDPLFESGDDDHFISTSRSIQSVLITVSIMFGL